MSSFTEFLAMGGYGFYVWWSYGLTALVLIANCWAPIARRRRLERSLTRRFGPRPDHPASGASR